MIEFTFSQDRIPAMNLPRFDHSRLPMHGTMGFLLLFLSALPLTAEDWPQWLGPNRDSVWRESGIVQRFPTNGPPILWRVNIGAGYSGPVVAKGRVYVTERQLAQG